MTHESARAVVRVFAWILLGSLIGFIVCDIRMKQQALEAGAGYYKEFPRDENGLRIKPSEFHWRDCSHVDEAGN